MATLLSQCVTDGFRAQVVGAFRAAGLHDAASLAEREPLQSGLLGALHRANAMFSDSDYYLPTDHAQALLAYAADPNQPYTPGHVLLGKAVEAELQNVIDAKPRAPQAEPGSEARLRARVAELEAQVRDLQADRQSLRAVNERNHERLMREGHAQEAPPPAKRDHGPRPRRKVA